MTTPTLDARITQRLADLTAQRAQRQDPLDLPRTMTQRQVNTYVADTGVLDRRIAAVHTAVAAMAALGTGATDQKWCTHLKDWRAVLARELLGIKSPIRDKAVMEEANNRSLSIKLIDFGFGAFTAGPVVDLSPLRLGELMMAAGYGTAGPQLHGPNGWQGSLPEVERRIADVVERRRAAQAALEDALLDDDTRSTRDAEGAELRSAFNGMRVKMSADPHAPGLVAFTDDGDVLPVSSMTPLQRKAFEWANAPYAVPHAEPAV